MNNTGITISGGTQKFMNAPMAVMPYVEQAGSVVDELPVMIYDVKLTMQGYILEKVAMKFELPEKLYGSIEPRAAKIMRAYNRRTKSTGVILDGDKGCGKTELLKLVSNLALEQGIPVVRVSDPHSGDAFKAFIDSLGPIALVFDEFAKIYEKGLTEDDVADPQADLLSMFDGFGSSKNLHIITENDAEKINQYMRNRPGRFYYRFQYGKLEPEVISGFCEDHKVNPEFIDDLLSARNASDLFSFDILQNVVKEHQAYPDLKLNELIEDMNVNLKPPKYTMVIKEIRHPLIEAGIANITDFSREIKDCDYKLDPQYDSISVELNPTVAARRKFGEKSKMFSFVEKMVKAHNIQDKSAVKALIKEFNNMPMMKKKDLASACDISDYTTVDRMILNYDRLVEREDIKHIFVDSKLNATLFCEKELESKDSMSSYGTAGDL